MKVPPGTQGLEIFRLKGKGLPELDSRFRGDQLVRVFVVVPEKLTSEQKKALTRTEQEAEEERLRSVPGSFHHPLARERLP